MSSSLTPALSTRSSRRSRNRGRSEADMTILWKFEAGCLFLELVIWRFLVSYSSYVRMYRGMSKVECGTLEEQSGKLKVESSQIQKLPEMKCFTLPDSLSSMCVSRPIRTNRSTFRTYRDGTVCIHKCFIQHDRDREKERERESLTQTHNGYIYPSIHTCFLLPSLLSQPYVYHTIVEARRGGK